MIRRIVLQKPGEEIVAEKDTAGTWQVVSPESERATRSWKFNSVMTDVVEMEVVDFVSDNETDLSLYGLDQPSYSITLDGEEETVLKVFLGALDGELIYCMRSDIPSVYAIREDVADDLLLSLDEVLQKKPDVQEQ